MVMLSSISDSVQYAYSNESQYQSNDRHDLISISNSKLITCAVSVCYRAVQDSAVPWRVHTSSTSNLDAMGNLGCDSLKASSARRTDSTS